MSPQNQPEIKPTVPEEKPPPNEVAEQKPIVAAETIPPAPEAAKNQPASSQADLELVAPSPSGITDQDEETIAKREQAIESAERSGKFDPAHEYDMLMKLDPDPAKLVTIRQKMAKENGEDFELAA